MKITRVQFEGQSKNEFLSYASITLDNLFSIHGLKIVKSKRDPSVTLVFMPTRQKTDGTYVDVAHPITPDCRAYVVSTVLQAWLDWSSLPEPERQAVLADRVKAAAERERARAA